MADSLSKFYAGGSNVPAGTQGDNGAIPSSGEIALSDFYGAPKNIIAATGGTVTTDGDYKVHTFTSSGTFTVTSVIGSPTVDFLIIAGGGGGGTGYYAAGGGAGGLRTSYGSTSGGGAAAESGLTVTAQA